jgi:hypothetical protein
MGLFSRKEPAPVPLPPATGTSGIGVREFYEKALAANSEWVRFSDPKAFGVLVFLGLGIADLVGRAHELVHAHRHHGLAGDLATIAFWAAAVLACVTVGFVAHAVFPRVKQKADERALEASLFFFSAIARYETAPAYRAAVEKQTPAQLQDDIATQVWEVGRIAHIKHRAAKHAFWAVLGFLSAWAVARVALSFAV